MSLFLSLVSFLILKIGWEFIKFSFGNIANLSILSKLQTIFENHFSYQKRNFEIRFKLPYRYVIETKFTFSMRLRKVTRINLFLSRACLSAFQTKRKRSR